MNRTDSLTVVLMTVLGLLIMSQAPGTAVLLLRDPFPVINQQNLLNPDPDRNTRVLVFVRNLQLAANETAAAVAVNLTDRTNQSFDVTAENVWVLPNIDFSQITFRLPDTLAPSAGTIQIRVTRQASNCAFHSN